MSDWPEHDMLESPAVSAVPPLVERRRRRSGLSLIGAAIAVALMAAHHFGLGLDERPTIQWERL